MMKHLLLFGASLALCIPASAGLVGYTVETQYLYPDFATVYDSADVVVGPGVELTNFPVLHEAINVDLSDANIYVTYNYASTWDPGSFNGLHFYDVLSQISGITGVSMNAATNMAGLTADRITFDQNNIWVNWADLAFDENTIVSLDVTFADEGVPEPATWLSLASGLLVLMGWLRRRRAQAS